MHHCADKYPSWAVLEREGTHLKEHLHSMGMGFQRTRAHLDRGGQARSSVHGTCAGHEKRKGTHAAFMCIWHYTVHGIALVNRGSTGWKSKNPMPPTPNSIPYILEMQM